MSGVSRIRGWAAAAAALLGCVTVVACASSKTQQVRAAAQSSTVTASGVVHQQTFTPYAATGTLVVPVADHVSGSCWTGSIAVPSPGVYRCMAGNEIFDPCFADTTQPQRDTVACVQDPWSPAHVVTLTAPLPSSTAAGQTRTPWALELANHARCVAVTGTVGEVNGVSLNYVCGTDLAAGIIQNDGSHIVVDYGSSDAGPLHAIAVVTAWRG
jgi:hypothetical protein